MSLLRVENISKEYGKNETLVKALDNVSFEVEKGEFVAIISIINTLNNSINNRKREFAILKSLGMDDSSFNKMIALESILVGINSLSFGIIIVLIIYGLLCKVAKSISVGATKIVINFPTNYFIAGIIGVIIIIFINMLFSINKIKKDNIIDTIRNDNL